jgi:biopolymer transport protein ExbD
MRRILAALIAMTTSAVFAGESATISVRVKQDGQMCEVLNQITECSTLPDILAQEFGVDRNISLVVSPDGCGESAIGSVRVVVDKLKAAGYLQVTLAGSLAKPNAKCAR